MLRSATLQLAEGRPSVGERWHQLMSQFMLQVGLSKDSNLIARASNLLIARASNLRPRTQKSIRWSLRSQLDLGGIQILTLIHDKVRPGSEFQSQCVSLFSGADSSF